MKHFEEPKMDVLNIQVEDVITTSPSQDEGNQDGWE